jgi:hypothetical protein
MATHFKESNLDWSDTTQVLTELIEKMEQLKDTRTNLDDESWNTANIAKYTAITYCIKLIEEKREELKDSNN